MDTRMLSLIGIALLTVSACSTHPTVSHTDPHGIIVMAPARTASDYFEVQLREVDGEQVLGQQNAYWLAPGRHTLRFTAIFTDRGRALLREVRETRQDQQNNVAERGPVIGRVHDNQSGHGDRGRRREHRRQDRSETVFFAGDRQPEQHRPDKREDQETVNDKHRRCRPADRHRTSGYVYMDRADF